MRLTFYDNACVVLEHGGYKLLADPWLTDGAFPPYKGAYLDLPDRRVYVRVELTEEYK